MLQVYQKPSSLTMEISHIYMEKSKILHFIKKIPHLSKKIRDFLPIYNSRILYMFSLVIDSVVFTEDARAYIGIVDILILNV